MNTIFTFDDLIEFRKESFSDYTLFIKGYLHQKGDGNYICKADILSPKEIELIDLNNNIYSDKLYLLTGIDVVNHFIDFNLIGSKQDLLKYLDNN